MLKQKFRKFDNFVFDLDGTVWRWVKLYHGAQKVFRELHKMDKEIIFVTNNVALTLDGFARKLRRFGIEAEPEQIYNPTLVAKILFKRKSVLCMTEEGIKRDLRKFGINITFRNPDVVITADYADYRLRSLSLAYAAVKSGSKLYKTASGGIWASWGKFIPSASGIATTIELLTKREGELIGKPSRHMISLVKKLNFNPSRTVLFGDEVKSDIVFGSALGFKTGLVLTGRGKIEDIPEYDGGKPDWVLKSIKDIVS